MIIAVCERLLVRSPGLARFSRAYSLLAASKSNGAAGRLFVRPTWCLPWASAEPSDIVVTSLVVCDDKTKVIKYAV